MYAGLVCPKNILFFDSQQKFLSKTSTHHKSGKAEFHSGLRPLVGHLLSTITLIKNGLTAGEGEKHLGCLAESPGVVWISQL